MSMSQGKRRHRKVRYQKKSEVESQIRWSKGMRDGFDSDGGVVCQGCFHLKNEKDVRERTIIESVPVLARQVVYRLHRGICPKCFKVYAPGLPALPKNLYGNSLIAQAAVMHFVHGIPIGKLLGIFGENVSLGGLMESFHRLGRLASSAREVLINEYSLSKVKHADETGWRNDGRSGWAWLFATPGIRFLSLGIIVRAGFRVRFLVRRNCLEFWLWIVTELTIRRRLSCSIVMRIS
jgi:hypothetical protein